MSESTIIKADDQTNVFVDQWEEDGIKGIWLSIQMRRGSANCVITEENARAMIVAIKAALGDAE